MNKRNEIYKFFKNEIEDEHNSKFSRLSNIPDTYVKGNLKFFNRLDPISRKKNILNIWLMLHVHGTYLQWV